MNGTLSCQDFDCSWDSPNRSGPTVAQQNKMHSLYSPWCKSTWRELLQSQKPRPHFMDQTVGSRHKYSINLLNYNNCVLFWSKKSNALEGIGSFLHLCVTYMLYILKNTKNADPSLLLRHKTIKLQYIYTHELHSGLLDIIMSLLHCKEQ